jgi:metal-responsive CopG/Arc/MetJ family transcriptional regulator
MKNKTSTHQKEPVAKVSVSFPPELLQQIDREAAADHRSRSQWIALQLERLLVGEPEKDS